MSFPPPKPNPWAFGLGVVVLLVIPHGIQLISLMAALGFSYYVHYMRQRARAALSWPLAEGTLLDVKVTRGSECERVEVAYLYHVEGHAYHGWRLRFTDSALSLPEVKHRLGEAGLHLQWSSFFGQSA